MTVPLTPTEYLRMSGIIAAVVDETGTKACRGCLSFAMAGSVILRQVFGKEAYPLAGAAFYRVDDNTGFTLAYGNAIDGKVSSGPDSFHSWILCDGYVIDLLAPLFPESVKDFGRTEVVPRRMFQKPAAAMSQSPYELAQEGDFYFEFNRALSTEYFSFYLDDPSYMQLVRVCVDWFKKSTLNGDVTYTVPRRDGSTGVLAPHQFILDGAW